MKVVKNFQHDPLRRQCAEAIWIKNIDPSKLINNKKEYHQPGDVQLRYEKNENPEIKRRKIEAKDAREIKINTDKNKAQEAAKTEKYGNENMPVAQFIRSMRLENENRKSSEYSCNHCDYKTKEKVRLKIHNETVHEKTGYSCNQCEYKTNEKGRLKIHKESVHEKIDYSCNQCDYMSKEEDHLKSHINSIHENMNDGEEFQISTQETIEDSRTRRKLTTLGKDINLKCTKCEWSSKSKTLLNRHMLRDHEESQRTVINPTLATRTITPEKETQIEDKNSRKKKMTAVKKYVSKRIKCEQCDMKFNKIERFNSHMDSDHKENKEIAHSSNKVTLPVKTRSHK